VNSREHLESLVEARDRGVGSIQEFARQQAAQTPGHDHETEPAPARAKVA
jgi:hypothetical protein